MQQIQGEKMSFEEEYPIEGDLRLTAMNKSGMVFTIIPLVSIDMEPLQIRAELKVARIKLNEAMVKWDKEHIKLTEVREAIDKIIPPDELSANNMIWNNALKKEVGIEDKKLQIPTEVLRLMRLL